MRNLIVLSSCLLAFLFASCGPSKARKDIDTMGHMKKLIEAKINDEGAGKPTPGLAELGTRLGIDVSGLVATEHWSSTNAPSDAVVLHPADSSPEKGIVGRNDGSVIRVP